MDKSASICGRDAALRSTRTLGGTVTYLRRLLFVELAAQIALLGCAILIAALFAVLGLKGASPSLEVAGTPAWVALSAAAFIALMVYLYSVGPVALVIAPIYALFEARGWVNLVTSASIGLIPGLTVLAYAATPLAQSGAHSALALACLATGVTVAIGVYLVRTWSTGRGSAA